MKQKLVVLTGAGISAESGLKTFRDGDGLWENYRIEDVATPEAWKRNPEMVLRFYNERRKSVQTALPNAAHVGLFKLEELYDVYIVTQNIDDLHERAGSKNVLHLHGEIFKMRSEKNEQLVFEVNDDIRLGDLAADGGQFRPHIVWFGEDVPMITKAVSWMEQADIFVLVGSSLLVYPAAGLLHNVPKGAPKYIIDKLIPEVHYYDNIIPIEKTASEGIEELIKRLS